jgi:hypothetical protein
VGSICVENGDKHWEKEGQEIIWGKVAADGRPHSGVEIGVYCVCIGAHRV